MYIETCDYDDDGRVIFRRREEDGLIQEWDFEYNEDGEQIVACYFEEILMEGDLYTNYK